MITISRDLDGRAPRPPISVIERTNQSMKRAVHALNDQFRPAALLFEFYFRFISTYLFFFFLFPPLPNHCTRSFRSFFPHSLPFYCFPPPLRSIVARGPCFRPQTRVYRNNKKSDGTSDADTRGIYTRVRI